MPSRESLTEPVEGLSKEGGGGGTEVEIKPQQNIHADEGGHKDGLGSLSFGQNDGVRSERGAPRRFFCLAEISLRVFDGLFDHINRHFERSRKLVDKSGTFFEIARAKLLKPPQVPSRRSDTRSDVSVLAELGRVHRSDGAPAPRLPMSVALLRT